MFVGVRPFYDLLRPGYSGQARKRGSSPGYLRDGDLVGGIGHKIGARRSWREYGYSSRPDLTNSIKLSL